MFDWLKKLFGEKTEDPMIMSASTPEMPEGPETPEMPEAPAPEMPAQNSSATGESEE